MSPMVSQEELAERYELGRSTDDASHTPKRSASGVHRVPGLCFTPLRYTI